MTAQREYSLCRRFGGAALLCAGHNESMGDLKDARLIYLKGFLFLVIGILGASGLLIENFSFQNVFLLALTVWAFCRFYYFLFYVIEKYVDGNFKFAGVSSFLIYLWQKRRAKN